MNDQENSYAVSKNSDVDIKKKENKRTISYQKVLVNAYSYTI